MSDSSSMIMNMGAEVAKVAGPVTGQPIAAGDGNKFANILQSVLPAGQQTASDDVLLNKQIEINPLLFSQMDDSQNPLLMADDIDLDALFGGKALPDDEQGIAWQTLLSEYDSTDPNTPRLIVAKGDEEGYQIAELNPADIFTGKLPPDGERAAADDLPASQQTSLDLTDTAGDDDTTGELSAAELVAALALANRQDTETAPRQLVTATQDENSQKLSGLEQVSKQPPVSQNIPESVISAAAKKSDSEQFSADKFTLPTDDAGTNTNFSKSDIATYFGADSAAAKPTGQAMNHSVSMLGASTYAAVSGMHSGGATSQSNAPLIASLTVPPDNPAWGDIVGDRVQWMATQNIQEARISLNPPELGLLEVRVQIGHNQQTSISFSTPHAQVRDALESAVPRLREMFGDSGLTLGDVNVSHQSMSDQRHPGNGNQAASPPTNRYSNTATEAIAPLQQQQIVMSGSGMLDLYA